LKRYRKVCNPLAVSLLTGIALVFVLLLPTHFSYSSFLSKSPLISHSPPLEYQVWTPPNLSSMKMSKPSLPPSFLFGSADEPSPASLNDTCICCKLMQINAGGLSIILVAEGFVATPYRCPAGIASIGYGSTILLDGRRVTMASKAVTKNEAKALLRRHLDHVESDILRVVRVPLNQNEFSALCSFVYNLGISRLISSTLKMRLNRNERLGAANEFPKWRRANGRILRGLVIRREAERQLFLTPVDYRRSP